MSKVISTYASYDRNNLSQKIIFDYKKKRTYGTILEIKKNDRERRINVTHCVKALRR